MYNHYLKRLLEKKVDGSGVYAEGTGYLRYVNEEVAPLLSIALDNGWLTRAEFPANYTRTGNWLLQIADPSGSIPAIDDGEAGRNLWLAPYARLNSNIAFKAYSNGPFYGNPTEEHMVNRKLLSYPWGMSNGTVLFSFTQSDFIGSVGKLNLNPASGVNSTLTILAEKGNQRSEGYGHDQQDNSSITLNRHVSGGTVDQLVIDPPYGGYKYREKTSSNRFHNTVLLSGSGVSGNGRITYSHLHSILTDAFPDARFVGIDLLPYMTSDDIHIIGGAGSAIAAMYFDILNVFGSNLPKLYPGGGDAELEAKFPGGMIIKQTYDDAGGDVNRRAVFTCGQDFVVVDAIQSTRGQYKVHYNLPKETIQNSRNLYTADNVGDSKLMLAIFGEDEGSGSGTLQPWTDYPDQAGQSVEVRRLHYANNNPAQTGGEFGYISILSPRAKGESIPYSYRKATCAGASVCIERSEPGAITYFFLNDGPTGAPLRVRIPVTARNVGVETDARFGYLKCDSKTGFIRDARLFNFTSASVNGVALTFPGTGMRGQGSIANATAKGDAYKLETNGTFTTQTSPRFNLTSLRAGMSAIRSLLLE